MKKRVLLTLLIIVLSFMAAVPCSAATIKTLVDTQDFCSAVSRYLESENQAYGYLEIEDVDVNAPGYQAGEEWTYKYIYKYFTPETIRKCSLIKFYRETDSIVVFHIAGMNDKIAYDTIGDYKFYTANCFYTKDDSSRSGNFVYVNGKIYDLKTAVKKGLVELGEMARIIPNAEYIGHGKEPVWIDYEHDYSDNKVLVVLTDEAASLIKQGNLKFDVDYFKDSDLGINDVVNISYGLYKAYCLELDIHNHQNVLNVIEALKAYDIIESAEPDYYTYIPEDLEPSPEPMKINPMEVTTKTKVVKYNKVKKAKQTVAPITVKKAVGKVTYKKLSGSKKLLLKANGKIVVKKGTKKGEYTAKIKVTAKGNANYKSASKTVKIKIKVK
ncbi:MAG: hypothetical protein IJT79_06285 [Ruminococcus sp.]|nr:hypothetical protein [Ruminococcus sp.]